MKRLTRELSKKNSLVSEKKKGTRNSTFLENAYRTRFRSAKRHKLVLYRIFKGILQTQAQKENNGSFRKDWNKYK